jgi:hypothetical protein
MKEEDGRVDNAYYYYLELRDISFYLTSSTSSNDRPLQLVVQMAIFLAATDFPDSRKNRTAPQVRMKDLLWSFFHLMAWIFIVMPRAFQLSIPDCSKVYDRLEKTLQPRQLGQLNPPRQAQVPWLVPS